MVIIVENKKVCESAAINLVKAKASFFKQYDKALKKVKASSSDVEFEWVDKDGSCIPVEGRGSGSYKDGYRLSATVWDKKGKGFFDYNPATDKWDCTGYKD